MNRLQKGALIGLACGVLAGCFPAKDQVIEIEAYIDGTSDLYIQDNNLWWHHRDFSAPGRWNNLEQATFINGEEWFPEWPQPGNNIFCNCKSSVLNNAFGAFDGDISVEVLDARGNVTITQQIGDSEDKTAIVAFDDYYLSGADWYRVRITAANISAE